MSGRSETIAEEIARPALARHLVAMAKQGVKREITLAEAGLEYLISLTPRSQAAAPEQGDIIGPQSAIATFAFQAFHFRIERPGAKFLLQWRIPWTFSHRTPTCASIALQRDRSLDHPAGAAIPSFGNTFVQSLGNLNDAECTWYGQGQGLIMSRPAKSDVTGRWWQDRGDLL